ncbi:MAG: hypothetical protein ACREF3_18055 [Acetobacteraceae bacterium]
MSETASITSGLILVRQPDLVPSNALRATLASALSLQDYGGSTIQDLSYKAFYIGAAWNAATLRAQRASLDTALATAMTDPTLNQVFPQYFNAKPVTAKPLQSDQCLFLNKVDWQPYFYNDDVVSMIASLYGGNQLPPGDLRTFCLILVLPPGTILYQAPNPATPGESNEKSAGGFTDSMDGLASYHSAAVMKDGTRIYYAVTVWSDGENGAAIPGWQPWENVCAGLYHELAETRTNPDLTKLPPNKNWGWASVDGDEIGDLSVIWAGDDPAKVFVKDIAGISGVPVALLWSDKEHGPFDPRSAAGSVATPRGRRAPAQPGRHGRKSASSTD